MVFVSRSSLVGLSARSLLSWVCRLETLRRRGRQAEADQGLRPGLPSSEEREQIRRLERIGLRGRYGRVELVLDCCL